MNYNPNITVIVPTYNEEKSIKSTLIAVKRQKCDLTYEIIVVDGQSTDNTVSIAKNFARITHTFRCRYNNKSILLSKNI